MSSGFGVTLRCIEVLSGLTLLDGEHLPGPRGSGWPDRQASFRCEIDLVVKPLNRALTTSSSRVVMISRPKSSVWGARFKTNMNAEVSAEIGDLPPVSQASFAGFHFAPFVGS